MASAERVIALHVPSQETPPTATHHPTSVPTADRNSFDDASIASDQLSSEGLNLAEPTSLSTPSSSPSRSSSADSTTGTNPVGQTPPSPPNNGPQGPKDNHGCFYNFCTAIFKCFMMIFTFGQYDKNG